MDNLAWKDMGIHFYVVVGASILVLLAIVACFARYARTKLPAILLSVLGLALAGVFAAGVVYMVAQGYDWNPKATTESAPQGNRGAAAPPAGATMAPPDFRNALTGLVIVLDQLTSQPERLKLTAEQKKIIHEQLKDLDQLAELTQYDAGDRLEEMWKAISGHRKSIEEAGWTPRGGAASQTKSDLPNPFKDDKNRRHLKSLQEHVGKD